jgi:hypothetical protein
VLSSQQGGTPNAPTTSTAGAAKTTEVAKAAKVLKVPVAPAGMNTLKTTPIDNTKQKVLDNWEDEDQGSKRNSSEDQGSQRNSRSSSKQGRE